MLVGLELYCRCLFLFFKFLTDITPEAEVTLWNKFFDAGVYITSFPLYRARVV